MTTILTIELLDTEDFPGVDTDALMGRLCETVHAELVTAGLGHVGVAAQVGSSDDPRGDL